MQIRMEQEYPRALTFCALFHRANVDIDPQALQGLSNVDPSTFQALTNIDPKVVQSLGKLEATEIDRLQKLGDVDPDIINSLGDLNPDLFKGIILNVSNFRQRYYIIFILDSNINPKILLII